MVYVLTAKGQDRLDRFFQVRLKRQASEIAGTRKKKKWFEFNKNQAFFLELILEEARDQGFITEMDAAGRNPDPKSESKESKEWHETLDPLRMKAFNQALREGLVISSDEAHRLYHATPASNIESIFSEGLRTRYINKHDNPEGFIPDDVQPGRVFLSSDRGYAGMLAEEYEPGPEGQWAELEVRLPGHYAIHSDEPTAPEGVYVTKDIPPEVLRLLWKGRPVDYEE